MNVTVPTPAGELSAWFAPRSGGGSWPGVVVVHEAWGRILAFFHQHLTEQNGA